jgi:hypothetical protein
MPISQIATKAAVISPALKLSNPASGGFDAVMKAVASQKQAMIGPIDAASVQKGSPVQHVIATITHSENTLRDLVHKGLTGTNFSPEKLIVLQASVYEATLKIDVISKGVEQTTSCFKTLMQSQI